MAESRGKVGDDTTRSRVERQGTERAEVVVAGGGLVGTTLALALAKGGLDVALVDPAGGVVPRDGRASAIAAGARRMFETLEAWPSAPNAAQPILEMIVTDSRVEDAVRPSFLTFQGETEPGEPFAHMVENAVLLDAIVAAARAAGVRILADKVARWEAGEPVSRLHLASGTALSAPLIAACDGARSTLREAARIAMVGWDYGQSGIVTTVVHEREHMGRAEEHFMPAGPFAILPLADDVTGRHRSSLVWTERTEEAARIVALPSADFHDALMERFGHHLGEVEVIATPRAYPLGLKVAKTFLGPRLALVGDAAHIIHPIAGQGLNMGLRDVAALAEVLIDARRLGLDVGAVDVLERYERWRRFDTAMMGVATDGLNRLFSVDSTPLKGLRDFGLGLVDRMPRVKDLLIRNAAGLVGDVPKLMTGRGI